MRNMEGVSTSAAGSKAAVSAKSAAMSADSCGVTAPAAPTTSAAATACVCFEREKRNDDEQHCGNTSAGRQCRSHGAGAPGSPYRRGPLRLGTPLRTKDL
jgi:hypothetical protein